LREIANKTYTERQMSAEVRAVTASSPTSLSDVKNSCASCG
jgi:hypothetical protein